MNRILVLEDGSIHFNQIEAALKRGEFEVDRASTVKQAKALLQQHKYYAAIIDMELGEDAYGGFQLVNHLAENYPSKPFIILTNHYDKPEYPKMLRELGLPASLIMPKKYLENEVVFLEALTNSFTSHWDNATMESIQVGSSQTSLVFPLAFFKMHHQDHGTIRIFLQKDQVLYFEGDGGGGVKLHYVENNQLKHLNMTTTLAQLIPQVSAKWNNFNRLGASFYVNLEKLNQFYAGDRKLFLKDAISGIECNFVLSSSGVTTLLESGLMIRAHAGAQ